MTAQRTTSTDIHPGRSTPAGQRPQIDHTTDRKEGSTTGDLREEVAARYREVNGAHPMSAGDDDYVDRQFVTLDAVCAGRDQTPGDVRAAMLGGRIPLPSYLRSDGAEMVPADLFGPADDAGSIDRLPDWFTKHWPTAEEGAAEWDAYLSGQYVCLQCVTPANIQRKTALVTAIEHALSRPQPELTSWLEQLHAQVDELDALEPPFAPDYDRLRFGGPSSRSQCIDDVRDRFPRPSPGSRPTTAESE